MSSDKTLIVAQSQQRPSALDVEGTLHRLAQTAEQAADWDAQLLVLPEMSITGYNITLTEIANVAEACDGRIFSNVATLCQKYNMAIVYGYAERGADGNYYNSAQLIDNNGVSLLNYRKTHLWGDLDRRLFTAGDALSPVVDVFGWKVGAAICYDSEFPETLRHLALNGAELVVIPTGLMTPWRDVAERVMPVRAYENQLYVAYTNYCGEERDITYEGYSSMADPNGHVLASALSESVLLTATLERQVLLDARAALPYLSQRRPELYATLTEPNVS